MRLRKIFAILLVTFMLFRDVPVLAYTMAPEYLCEQGVKYYQQGRITDAVMELKKALIANPDYEPAKRYMAIIQRQLAVQQGRENQSGISLASIEERLSDIDKKLEQIYWKLEKLDQKNTFQDEVALLKSSLKGPHGALPAKDLEVNGTLDTVLKALEKIEKRAALLDGFEEARQKAGKQPSAVVIGPEKDVIIPYRNPSEPVVLTSKEIKEEAGALETNYVEQVRTLRKETAAVPEKNPGKVAGFSLEKKPIETAIIQRNESSMPEISSLAKDAAPPQIINLYENYNGLKFPLEIEKDKSIVIKGHTIVRFLATEPGIVDVARIGSDEIVVTAKGFGRTYFHVWDDKGRWTFELQTIPPKIEGLTVAEQMRRLEERYGSFKMTYDMDWSSSESGGRIGTLKRQSYAWSHFYTIRGETPYGEFDSNATVQTNTVETSVTGYSVGLTNGRFMNFKDFAFRIFDISPAISNLAYGGTNLRGFQFYSPAFNKTVDYTVFQGRETGGLYGMISPGLTKKKSSFIEGVDINFTPKGNFNYGLSAFHGFGGDRAEYLNDYGYSGDINWKGPGKWTTRYEVGYDTENMAHLLSGRYIIPKMNFSYELRDINKDYMSITGAGWRTGERGGLFTLGLTPTERWSISNTLDVYQDRLYPASDNEGRWNQDYSVYSNYRITPATNWSVDYVLQNDLGKISQNRYQSAGTGLSTTFDILSRKVSVYTNYRHSDNQNYSNPSGSSLNDSISNGIRFKLLGELYYYLSKQWSWIDQRYDGGRYRTEALETGVDMNTRIGKSSFYQTSRLIYRDEESGGSDLGMVSGEDYVEGYLELGFRPNSDWDVYCSGRLRQVWPENGDQRNRVDADFTAGLRYVWDTGFRWEAVSSVEGYVFKDLNSDGLRQRDEAPIEGVTVWVGKKEAVTDIFGYYKIINVKGKKTVVNVDVITLPQGFVLTGPGSQEMELSQSRKIRVDFGVVSRSEIAGIVFHDANGDGKYNAGDEGIRGVVVTLEDGKKAVTDPGGRYVFGNAAPGDHVVTIDLNSIPVIYLPKVALTKNITLFEGVTYNFNIPLKKTQ